MLRALRFIVFCAAAFLLGVPLCLADGWHGSGGDDPVTTTETPESWGKRVKDAVKPLDPEVATTPDDPETEPDKPPVKREPNDPAQIKRLQTIRMLINVLKYLSSENVIPSEFPKFDTASVPRFVAEAKKILIGLGSEAAPYLVEELVGAVKYRDQAAKADEQKKLLQEMQRLSLELAKEKDPKRQQELQQQLRELQAQMGNIANLNDLKRSPHFEKDLIEVLTGLGWAAVPELLNAMKDDNADVRKEVSAILKKITGKSPGDTYDAWKAALGGGKKEDPK